MICHDLEERLREWQAALNPLKLDIVGDFAGKELFAIVGEALVAHCVRIARVDFDAGFQLLHAVHAVEAFLANLSQRGCNFHVLWFDDYAHLCVPEGVRSEHGYKYKLARATLIQHFALAAKQGGDARTVHKFSYEFASMTGHAFRDYLVLNPLHFFMCSGATDLDHVSIGYRMASTGHCIAFIDDSEFHSSKVFASVVTPRGNLPRLAEGEKDEDEQIVAGQLGRPAASVAATVAASAAALSEIHRENDLTARELIMLLGLSHTLASEATEDMRRTAAALLAHLVLIQDLGLERQTYMLAFEKSAARGLPDFVTKFSEAAACFLHAWAEGDFASAKWDAYDLIDGRLLTLVANDAGLGLPQGLRTRFIRLATFLKALSKIDVSTFSSTSTDDGLAKVATGNTERTIARQQAVGVLPFAHPVFDPLLEGVRLATDESAVASPASSRIFRELTHWHNAKKPIDPKYTAKPLDFYARRRNQRLMRDTVAYSASLTGVSGKNIEPEIIVVPKDATEKSAEPQKEVDWRIQLKTKEKQKKENSKKKDGPKSGKDKAREEAKALQASKTQGKSLGAETSWKERCKEFEKEMSMVTRFLKVDRYLMDLGPVPLSAVGSEVTLYLCHALAQFPPLKKAERDGKAFSLLAILWSKAVQIPRLPLTQEVAAQLMGLAKALQLPLEIPAVASLPKRALQFRTSIGTAPPVCLDKSQALRFQLQHCGPYLERSFDSAPDDRVRFEPDAWQRQVLDAIDANKSLFVVAPTSSGKTFISFYAMKKILKADNSGVIVYVAPTKALVNQIAAEIQARFRKTYDKEGRSVWAVHTRDYRINNTKGCQVLVTVPHVLQIMLLAPSNAMSADSWSRRVKRIIFDEVHCIGQSEEGVVWEQLLLLAPCPVIALSATVGNPLEFREWLAATQKAKGFELEMVVHTSRYSDLRKFIYHSPSRAVSKQFDGLQPIERLPFPGLDAGDDVSSKFVFVHPVGGLVGRNVSTLEDSSLEPRDCLSLWAAMKKHSTAQHAIETSLGPEKSLPAHVKKADVVKWEMALKKRLADWMTDPDSPFDGVRDELRGAGYDRLVANETGEMKSDGSRERRKADGDESLFNLATDLRACGALPAIFFNYDRQRCEEMLAGLLEKLESAEAEFRKTSKWQNKLAEYEKWKLAREKAKDGKKAKATKKKGPRDDGDDQTRLDQMRDEAGQEISPWTLFDPMAAIDAFSFADRMKITQEELQDLRNSLKWSHLKPFILEALSRGIGVHHAGMNRKYRQAVELLVRKGYMTIVIATGTLALGINMPCKTVVFAGNSAHVTALNYRQGSGRAGRRGFDVLGNVVFHDIPSHRALEIMSAKLPDLRGQFPISVSLVLRLFTLLHGTKNSAYAVDAITSLITQTRLFMGGPSAEMSIKHHVRFTIEYLRRQNLLSEKGEPLHFAGLIGHLYYTENAVFAFHSLLKDGYLHKLCSAATDRKRQKDVVLELCLVLSHLFCRIPCHRYEDKKWLADTVKPSSSLVLLPDLPDQAVSCLKRHSNETLSIFRGYVSTYVDQYLADTPDDKLPFTGFHLAAGERVLKTDGVCPNKVRSPFSALSGQTDRFATIGELCDTVRAGVFLDKSAIPFIPMAPHETGGVPWNAYLYDFFKHGDLETLIKDNGIKRGDVWFHLKDFSTILATIVTSIANFLNPNAEVDEASMIDIQDAQAIVEENDAAANGAGAGGSGDEEDREASKAVAEDAQREKEAEKERLLLLLAGAKAKGAKGATGTRTRTADDWDAGSEDESLDAASDADAPVWQQNGESLVQVHKAFVMLQEEFDAKFFKIFA